MKGQRWEFELLVLFLFGIFPALRDAQRKRALLRATRSPHFVLISLYVVLKIKFPHSAQASPQAAITSPQSALTTPHSALTQPSIALNILINRVILIHVESASDRGARADYGIYTVSN